MNIGTTFKTRLRTQTNLFINKDEREDLNKTAIILYKYWATTALISMY